MTADTAPDTFAAAVEDALALAGPLTGLSGQLRDAVASSIHRYPASVPEPSAAWVDGAVASEQTDTLIWTAVVGVASTAGGDLPVFAETVTPVCSDAERLRSIVMGCCELEAALSAVNLADRVVVDGGLTTSLMSITSELLLTDPDVVRAADRFLTGRDAAQVVDRFVAAVLAGRIVALPKQDTAQVYTAEWAELRQLDPATRMVLPRLRDRPVIDSILQPGELLTGRPANVRIEAAGVRTGAATARAAQFERALARLRGADLRIVYFKPAGGAQRTIKAEFAATAGAAGTVAGWLSGQCTSPRLVEPFGQHMVDRACKELVRGRIAALSATLTSALRNDTATRRYRS